MKHLSIDIEEWRDIPCCDGKYQASTFGRIRSVDRIVYAKMPDGSRQKRRYKGKILRAADSKSNPHLYVSLGRGGNGRLVHELVALAFLGERPPKSDVCHIDGNPTNNKITNLRYDTRTENILDVYRTGGKWRKLSLFDIKEIMLRVDKGEIGHHLAVEFGVSDTTISKIKLRRYKSCEI